MRRRPLLISLIGILVISFGALAATVIAGNSPQLGLDLQGGASVTLQPVGEFNPDALDIVPEIYRSRVDSLGVAEPEVIRQGNTIVVNLPGVKDKDRAIQLIGATGKVLFRPVLSQLPLPEPIDSSKIPTSTTIASATTTTVSSAAQSSATSAPPTADTAATSAPTTTAAATSSSAQQSGFVGATATTPTTTATTPPTSAATSSATTVAGGPTTTAAPVDFASLVTPRDGDVADAAVLLPNRTGDVLHQMGPAFATGEGAISSATARLVQGEWQVQLTLNGGAEGLDVWNTWAGKCFNRDAECPTGGMAIVLDHRVISAPVPQTSFFDSPDVFISGGTGGFSEREARDLARVLAYGATPVEMEPLAAQTVSATLGEDSLRAAIIAGLIGIALVLIFMLLYYKSLALVVVAGLCVSGALLWSVISLLSQTRGLALTLAGVTGIIVSVGVTVDSYVVFFERLKDEVKSGRTFRSSAQRGFKGAWRTILAADTVSLIGAGVLWYLSVGSVRGFAFFLGLSTLCDMVVSYFFTRPAVLLLSRSKRYQTNHLLGVTTGEALVGGAA
jgi:preprotein translocase subunit SecD